MDIQTKLKILADSAKYDVSCSSSGSNRKNEGGIGAGHAAGICHSFAADGRCISLLKILFTNVCIYDCKYCVNRSSNKTERAAFTPEEIAQITIQFYRRNYIEGLFLSSGILKDPEHTMSLIYDAIYLLRHKYKFYGYVHVKTIPGASQGAIDKLGRLVDRMSINIELPSQQSLSLLAPDKMTYGIVEPMKHIRNNILQDKKFVRGGQSTQLIIGATPDTDLKIMRLSNAMYDKMKLKRVYYSAYMPAIEDELLPAINEPPLVRENKLYQADWLIRIYGYHIEELLNDDNPNFNLLLDPKSEWAIRNLHLFPMEINEVAFDTLIKIPGIGVTSAKKIEMARKYNKITFDSLKKMNVSLKRAQYFITCCGKYYADAQAFDKEEIEKNLISGKIPKKSGYKQISIFD